GLQFRIPERLTTMPLVSWIRARADLYVVALGRASRSWKLAGHRESFRGARIPLDSPELPRSLGLNCAEVSTSWHLLGATRNHPVSIPPRLVFVLTRCQPGGEGLIRRTRPIADPVFSSFFSVFPVSVRVQSCTTPVRAACDLIPRSP